MSLLRLPIGDTSEIFLRALFAWESIQLLFLPACDKELQMHRNNSFYLSPFLKLGIKVNPHEMCK